MVGYVVPMVGQWDAFGRERALGAMSAKGLVWRAESPGKRENGLPFPRRLCAYGVVAVPQVLQWACRRAPVVGVPVLVDGGCFQGDIYLDDFKGANAHVGKVGNDGDFLQWCK